MLITGVSGGLRNQMFQYAFYKNLKSMGRFVKLDIQSMWNEKNVVHNRYELRWIFKLNVDFASALEGKRCLGKLNEKTVVVRFTELLQNIV